MLQLLPLLSKQYLIIPINWVIIVLDVVFIQNAVLKGGNVGEKT